VRGSLIIGWIGFLLLFAIGTAAQSWIAYSSDGGRYRVDMPGTPTINAVPISIGGGQTVPMTEAVVPLQGATYLASYVGYPDRIARAASADLLLDRVRDGSSAGNVLRGEKTLALGRFPGREYAVIQTNGTTSAIRTYWVRGRLYQLMVTGGAGIESQPSTRRFFDSFELIMP
jgi:hypothetical protein